MLCVLAVRIVLVHTQTSSAASLSTLQVDSFHFFSCVGFILTKKNTQQIYKTPHTFLCAGDLFAMKFPHVAIHLIIAFRVSMQALFLL